MIPFLNLALNIFVQSPKWNLLLLVPHLEKQDPGNFLVVSHVLLLVWDLPAERSPPHPHSPSFYLQPSQVKGREAAQALPGSAPRMER